MKISSGLPLNLLLTLSLPVYMIAQSFSNIVWFFYAIPAFLIIYVHFSRYACKVSVTDAEIIVSYIAPWIKNVSLAISEISKIDYKRSYYDLLSHETRGGLYSFPRYPYDTLYISSTGAKSVEIRLNTMAFGFDKILNGLKTKVPVVYGV